MKEVLILGGAGFIGFNLALKLSERDNHNITIADNLSRGQMDSSLKELLKKENVTFIEGDFTNNDDFSMLLLCRNNPEIADTVVTQKHIFEKHEILSKVIFFLE